MKARETKILRISLENELMKEKTEKLATGVNEKEKIIKIENLNEKTEDRQRLQKIENDGTLELKEQLERQTMLTEFYMNRNQVLVDENSRVRQDYRALMEEKRSLESQKLQSEHDRGELREIEIEAPEISLEEIKKMKMNIPSSSNIKYFPNRKTFDASIFTKCSNCECALDGFQTKMSKKRSFCNILSCGHVLCKSCLWPIPPYKPIRKSCPICQSSEPDLEYPNIRGKGIGNIYCTSHCKSLAKFYCEECMRFFCSKEDCGDHSVIKIEEISVKNSQFNHKIFFSDSFIQELTYMENDAKSSLVHLEKQSVMVEKTFNSIIEAVVKRYSDIQKTIQAEKADVLKKVKEISKDVERTKRRIRVAFNIHEVLRSSSSDTNIHASDAYKMAAGSLLEKSLEVSGNVKTTSESTKIYKRDFPKGDYAESIVKDVKRLFPAYTVSNEMECEPRKVPIQADVRLRKKCQNYLGKILSSGTSSETIPSNRRKAPNDIPKINQPVVPQKKRRELGDGQNSETMNTEEPMILLKPESSNLAVKMALREMGRIHQKYTKRKMLNGKELLEELKNNTDQIVMGPYTKQYCKEVQARLEQEKHRNEGYGEPIFVDKKLAINNDVMSRMEIQEIQQELIKIEPPELLIKEIKKEEPI